MIPLVVEDCTIKFKKCMYEVVDYAEERSEHQKALCTKKEADGKKLALALRY